MKTLCTILFLAVIIASCTYPCAKSDGIRTNFIGFSEPEIQSFTIRKYNKGDNFSKLLDSLVVDSTVTRYKRVNDTLTWSSSLSTARMLSDFDYIIYIPAINSSYRITELYEPQQEGRKSTKKVMCGNAIVSCRINGQLTQIIYDLIYLKK